MGPALIRPLVAAAAAGAVALLVARFAGPYSLVQLAAGGTAGLLVYVPLAVPLDELRRWRSAVRRTAPAGVME
jgi:PST family polysaccharide transporter